MGGGVQINPPPERTTLKNSSFVRVKVVKNADIDK